MTGTRAGGPWLPDDPQGCGYGACVWPGKLGCDRTGAKGADSFGERKECVEPVMGSCGQFILVVVSVHVRVCFNHVYVCVPRTYAPGLAAALQLNLKVCYYIQLLDLAITCHYV
jgi:hypothetical protein